MIKIALGNLSIDEMQERSGVTFPDELIDYMSERRQQKAENIAVGMWHCFDIPFILVCGDKETVDEIYKHLKPLSSEFKEEMRIVVD